MDSHEIQAHALRTEADTLLKETRLLDMLERFGRVDPTGSYMYDLMTRRDIDLCLSVPTISTPEIFRLGAALAEIPLVGSMYYRNELVLQTEGNPSAVFWCVDLFPPSAPKWKVDILISTPDVVESVLEPGLKLMSQLTEETISAILTIKYALTTRDEYRQSYGSRAIYRAVLDDGITNLEQWERWWQQQQA